MGGGLYENQPDGDVFVEKKSLTLAAAGGDLNCRHISPLKGRVIILSQGSPGHLWRGGGRLCLEGVVAKE